MHQGRTAWRDLFLWSEGVPGAEIHRRLSALKYALRGRRFTADEGVKKAVHEWLAAQPKTFFSEGIQKLLERWNNCIAKHGDYVEK